MTRPSKARAWAACFLVGALVWAAVIVTVYLLVV